MCEIREEQQKMVHGNDLERQEEKMLPKNYQTGERGVCICLNIKERILVRTHPN